MGDRNASLRSFVGSVMHTTYYASDHILVIHVSDKPVVREVSQDWHTNISFAEDGSIVEIVLLDARVRGAYPVQQQAA